MQRANSHLPPNAARPAIIFFTDGKHDVNGVPTNRVLPASDRLFRNRSPFAFLPVGMGLNASDRRSLEASLVALRVVRGMDPCDGQASFEWPTVEFDSPEEAGGAVALALQNVTCTFTVAPPPATPPPAVPDAVRSVGLVPADASINLSWLPPENPGTTPIEDYQARCRPSAGGDWIGSAEGHSTETTAIVGPLANDVPYVCEVAAVNGTGPGEWTPAPVTASPFGRPPPPAKPTATPKDHAAHLVTSISAPASVTAYRFECSADGGASWAIARDVAGAPEADVADLVNGANYVCRAFASNSRGLSDASPLSDAFRPCGSLFECNPAAAPLMAVVLLVLLLALVYAIWRWWTGRIRWWVTATIDDFDTVTLGRGPNVGLSLIRPQAGGHVTDVVPDPSPAADVRVRYRGGNKFDVTANGRPIDASAGRPIELADAEGEPHIAVLRASPQPPRPSTPPDDEGNDYWRSDRPAGASPASSSSDSTWD
jgi:hypothetical protein